MKGLLIHYALVVIIGGFLALTILDVHDNKDRLDELEAQVALVERAPITTFGYTGGKYQVGCGDTVYTFDEIAAPAMWKPPDPDQYIVRIDTTGWRKMAATQGLTQTIWSRLDSSLSIEDVPSGLLFGYIDRGDAVYYFWNTIVKDSILPILDTIHLDTIYADKQLLWVRPDDLGRIKRVLEIE